MTVIGCNRYPRLKWTHNSDPVRRGFIAWPHGEGEGRAMVWSQANYPKEFQWAWTAVWPDRFGKSGGEADKQSAADKATIAYWDAMEATEGWKPVPDVVLPPENLVVVLFWDRLRRWAETTASTDEIGEQLGRYRMAATSGRSIISKTEDAKVWSYLTTAWLQLRFLQPNR